MSAPSRFAALLRAAALALVLAGPAALAQGVPGGGPAPSRAAVPAADAFALHAPFPNPFHVEATVRFTLAEPATVRLEVFDALGRRVATLAEGTRGAGTHVAVLEGSALPPGLYLIRLAVVGPSGERSATRRVVRQP